MIRGRNLDVDVWRLKGFVDQVTLAIGLNVIGRQKHDIGNQGSACNVQRRPGKASPNPRGWENASRFIMSRFWITLCFFWGDTLASILPSTNSR